MTNDWPRKFRVSFEYEVLKDASDQMGTLLAEKYYVAEQMLPMRIQKLKVERIKRKES